MLRNNDFPTDEKRRWVIATLLRIPAFLLGAKAIDELLPPHEEVQAIRKAVIKRTQETFDISEYRTMLKTYWQQNRTDTISDLMDDVQGRIGYLEKEVLYGGKAGREKRELCILLCGYHMLSANIASDQRAFDDCITHLNRTYTIAKERKIYKLQAAALLRRGWAFKERGEEHSYTQQFEKIEQDFTYAAQDFTLALSLKKYLYPGINGSLFVALGQVQAEKADTQPSLSRAIQTIDKAKDFVGKPNDEDDIHFIQLDEERYYLDRAVAYLSAKTPLACYPKDARRELRSALAAEPTPVPKRRQAYNLVLEAKSHYIEGEASTCRKRLSDAEDCYTKAARKANEALVIVSAIDSKINLHRISSLCQGLKTTDYGKKSIDVAELEVAVTSAQHPNMFT